MGGTAIGVVAGIAFLVEMTDCYPDRINTDSVKLEGVWLGGRVQVNGRRLDTSSFSLLVIQRIKIRLYTLICSLQVQPNDILDALCTSAFRNVPVGRRRVRRCSKLVVGNGEQLGHH